MEKVSKRVTIVLSDIPENYFEAAVVKGLLSLLENINNRWGDARATMLVENLEEASDDHKN